MDYCNVIDSICKPTGMKLNKDKNYKTNYVLKSQEK